MSAGSQCFLSILTPFGKKVNIYRNEFPTRPHKIAAANQQCMTRTKPILKAWGCGRSLVGIAGSNPAGSMDIFLL